MYKVGTKVHRNIKRVIGIKRGDPAWNDQGVIAKIKYHGHYRQRQTYLINWADGTTTQNPVGDVVTNHSKQEYQT
tara:strand:+ start:339 stop:563 length:225 start_codon:yes stop_codon:yes gene_type:complete